MSNASTTPATTARPVRPLLGILILLGAVACFACMDASVKWLNRDLKPVQIAGVRYLVSLMAVAVFINPWSHPDILKPRKLKLQFGRASFLIASTLCVFLALRFLPLTQLTAINFSAPLITALLAGPVLGERIGPRRLVAVLVGFAGVLVITRPFGGSVQPAVVLALMAALSGAGYYLTTRLLAAHDRPETTLFYTGLVGTVVLSPTLPFVWQSPSTPLVWGVLLGLGLLGALGHWLLILAHRHAPASVLAPFFYVQIIGAVVFSVTVFGERPDRWTLLGSATVIASGLYLLYRERVRRKFPSSDVSV